MEIQKTKFEKKLLGMWTAANELEEKKMNKEAEKLRAKYWKKYRSEKGGRYAQH